MNEVWLILTHYHMFFCWLVRNHVSRVVHTSENAVYKSVINFLIKNIKPRILLFLKRGRPGIVYTTIIIKRSEFSFCVRIKTSWQKRNFTFKTSEILIFLVEKVFFIVCGRWKEYFQKLTSFHFITHLRLTAHKKGAKSIFDRGRDFSDFVWFLQTFTLKSLF